MHRFNVNIGNNLKFGALYHQNMGESGDIYTDKISISLDDVSFFNSAISFDKIILGNFNVAFGQGVVIVTTDYFLQEEQVMVLLREFRVFQQICQDQVST